MMNEACKAVLYPNRRLPHPTIVLSKGIKTSDSATVPTSGGGGDGLSKIKKKDVEN